MEATKVTQTRYIEGLIDSSCIPAILSSDASDSGVPFRIKVCTESEQKVDTGAFMVSGLQCKIVDNPLRLLPDIRVQDSKILVNASKPLETFDQVYIWDKENNVWIDAATTTKDVETNYTKRIQWIILNKQLKNQLKLSTTYIRKLFRTMSLNDVDVFVRLTKYLNENLPKKEYVENVLQKARTGKYVEVKFPEFTCGNCLAGAKEAMRFYLNK